MGRKLYLDFRDVGRGCMPAVYNEPGEGRVAFNEEEVPSNDGSIRLNPEARYTITIPSSQYIDSQSSYFRNGSSVHFNYHEPEPVRFHGFTAEQVEQLANYFHRQTGLPPHDINVYNSAVNRQYIAVSVGNLQQVYPNGETHMSSGIYALTSSEINDLARYFSESTGRSPGEVTDYLNNNLVTRALSTPMITSGRALELQEQQAEIDSLRQRIVENAMVFGESIVRIETMSDSESGVTTQLQAQVPTTSWRISDYELQSFRTGLESGYQNLMEQTPMSPNLLNNTNQQLGLPVVNGEEDESDDSEGDYF